MLYTPPRRSVCGGACVVLALSLAACKGKRLAEELPAAQSHQAAEQNLASGGGGPAPAAAPTALPPAPGSPGERPSIDQSMGRDFQGELMLRVLEPAGDALALRYLN